MCTLLWVMQHLKPWHSVRSEQRHLKTQSFMMSELMSDEIYGTTWHAGILKHFRQVSSKLTTSYASEIVLQDTQIALPTALKGWVLQLAHEGHQAIVKTEVLLTTKVWFLDVDRKAEAAVHSCLACQAGTQVAHNEPLKRTFLPEALWYSISGDF